MLDCYTGDTGGLTQIHQRLSSSSKNWIPKVEYLKSEAKFVPKFK